MTFPDDSSAAAAVSATASLARVRQMPCPEQGRLMELYSDATQDFSEIVLLLKDATRSLDIESFNRIWEHCETARKRCSDIREQIYAHASVHRCALYLHMPRYR